MRQVCAHHAIRWRDRWVLLRRVRVRTPTREFPAEKGVRLRRHQLSGSSRLLGMFEAELWRWEDIAVEPWGKGELRGLRVSIRLELSVALVGISVHSHQVYECGQEGMHRNDLGDGEAASAGRAGDGRAKLGNN